MENPWSRQTLGQFHTRVIAGAQVRDRTWQSTRAGRYRTQLSTGGGRHRGSLPACNMMGVTSRQYSPAAMRGATFPPI
eukprot:1503296-Rhodomonas_salina.6